MHARVCINLLLPLPLCCTAGCGDSPRRGRRAAGAATAVRVAAGAGFRFAAGLGSDAGFHLWHRGACIAAACCTRVRQQSPCAIHLVFPDLLAMQGRRGGPAGGFSLFCALIFASRLHPSGPSHPTCSAEAPVVAQLVAASGVLRRCAKIAVAHPNCRWVPRQLWVPAVLLAACDSLWRPPGFAGSAHLPVCCGGPSAPQMHPSASAASCNECCTLHSVHLTGTLCLYRPAARSMEQWPAVSSCPCLSRWAR